jgi:cell wall-associated NlpC family hydrolase
VAKDYAARARALVGVPFRPQGRRREGLDCIGLVIETFGLAADSARHDYRLSGDHRSEIEQGFAPHFRKVRPQQMRAGDVLVMAVANNQYHLAVRTSDGFVHAHAGLRKVVETPGLPQWPLLSTYRKRSR